MIKPTVGRVVLVFRERAADEGHQGVDLDAAEPAFVTAVFADDKVNVAGFTAHGVPFAVCPIFLVQEEYPGEEPPRPYAEWMPYQVAAAKKFPVDLPKATTENAATLIPTLLPNASQAPSPGAVQQSVGLGPTTNG